MTWRITDRATFDALRRSGQRGRSGPISVVFLREEHSDRARVAYAVGRRSGGAVDRNRLRRRLRAAVRIIEADSQLVGGAYLVSPGPGCSKLGHEELVGALRQAIGRTQVQTALVGAENDRNAEHRT